ncbi:MAG: chemotaxis protein CheA [Promethearchaeota archaeon]|nr:MAG: chemotaxis protein CheA [Candidatus Lokiarchaeota archaeon]
MASKEDMKLFISETEDLIQKTEDEILKLESNPNNPKPVQELYFTFHTLKGLTAMAGFENVSKFCHHFETFLDKAKKDKSLLNKQEEFITFLFESLDLLKSILNRVKKGDFTDIDDKFLNDIEESIEGLQSDFDITFITPIDKQELDKLVSNKDNRFYKIYFVIQKTCVFKKVRLFIIFRALNEIGQITWSNPEPKILERGEFEDDFEIYFMSSKKSNEINKVLDEILEIENRFINELNAEEFKTIISDLISKSQRSKQKLDGKLFGGEGTYDEEIFDGKLEKVSQILEDFSEDTSKIKKVKVDIQILEDLMNYFGELVIIRNKINQVLNENQNRMLSNLVNNMEKPFLDIQEILFRLKLVRVESTFLRYKRLVRDVAKETGKKVKFILEGMNVEIDRKILEELNSPLIHLLRNAIYHGIESPNERKQKKKDEIGILKLKSYRSGGSIYIEVSDDGGGLNYDKIRDLVVEKGFYSKQEAKDLSEEILNQFILMPSFSTISNADIISGRGMGMAIVAEKLKELGGKLEIYTEKDKGSKFVVIVPFTKAIMKAQLMKIADDLFAIPTENIEQIYFFDHSAKEYINNELFYRINSHLVPVVELDKRLNLIKENDNKLGGNSTRKIAILCKNEDKNASLFIVDEVLQQMDIIVKPFSSSYSESQDLMGSTVLGDGSICLVIDAIKIISSNQNENQISVVNKIN